MGRSKGRDKSIIVLLHTCEEKPSVGVERALTQVLGDLSSSAGSVVTGCVTLVRSPNLSDPYSDLLKTEQGR